MDIQDWSTTAASNTDVDGIDIDEGCEPANINNALRAIMATLPPSAISSAAPGFPPAVPTRRP